LALLRLFIGFVSSSAFSWKQNVAVVWISQFISISAFAFSMPFAPFFIQELGITDDSELTLWVALFAAATPLALAISSPIWGVLADRYGHRIMLLRANVAAMVVVFLMAGVPDVHWLIICRFLQGLFTGTLTAAQTMVAAASPTHRSGFALGGLSSAAFGGVVAGSALGGIVAETFGCRQAFVIASLLFAVSTLLVFVGTREAFERPTRPRRSAYQKIEDVLSHLRPIFFILLVIGAMAVIRQFDVAFIPIWVQQLHGTIDGAAIRVGIMGAACSVAGFLSGVVFGRLADKLSIPALGRFASIGAGVFMVAQGLAPGIATLIGARWGMIFFSGGLDPVIQAWLAKSTSPEKRGLIFGCASSFRAVGWALGALLSGAVVAAAGLQMIFFFGGALFLILAPMIAAAHRSLVAAEIDNSRNI
jgi:DHA1 family multidrug resistance protein-like MFS transporter